MDFFFRSFYYFVYSVWKAHFAWMFSLHNYESFDYSSRNIHFRRSNLCMRFSLNVKLNKCIYVVVFAIFRLKRFLFEITKSLFITLSNLFERWKCNFNFKTIFFQLKKIHLFYSLLFTSNISYCFTTKLQFLLSFYRI